MKLKSIRLENFRAFVDTGNVPVKPITILVGRNSIGKSSFARVWSLLRQSVSERKRGPILWYGKHVDFGSFKDVRCRHTDSETIILTLDIGDLKNLTGSARTSKYADVFEYVQDFSVRMELAFDAKAGQTFCSRITFTLDGMEAGVEYDSAEKISKLFCGDLVSTIPSNYIGVVRQGAIFPLHQYFRRMGSPGGEDRWVNFRPPHSDRVNVLLRNILGQRFGINTVSDFSRSLPIASSEVFLKILRELPYTQVTWKNYCSELSENSRMLKELQETVILSRLESIIEILDGAVEKYFSGVRYIEPIRASAERYYRLQELSVDEIDSRGSNLAVYLDSLKSHQTKALNVWLGDKLGFTVGAERIGGHLVVKVKDGETGRQDNMADMGFGFSQILPIAVQAWAASASIGRTLKNRDSCLVFEQPELHLHPAMQAKVGEMVVAASKEARTRNPNFGILVETHSSHLISRIGDLIALGKCSVDDVQVVLFESGGDGGTTKVRSVSFNENGQLIDWPFGFFDAGWPQS